MSKAEWYESREWNPDRLASFLRRAGRARHRKFHYFHRQASVILEAKLPHAALGLLDELALDLLRDA